jgi:hypothetical protein
LVELVHKIDLSDRAYPSEDYIFEGLHKYKNRLCIDLILEASMVDHLIDFTMGRQKIIRFLKNIFSLNILC